MEEKRPPRELLLSAIRHFDDATEDFELGTFGWAERDDVEKQFYALREKLIEALAPHFIPPADEDGEAYNEADHLLDLMKVAGDLDGPASLLTGNVARALADANARAREEIRQRQAA